ncbi:MAG TPA: PHP domain-containing protein [Kutzneria sp.]
MPIDLHAHTSCSDGTDSPTELMAAAAAAGLDAVAITDHDTTAGWAEAAAAVPPGMRLIRGAELSCESPDGRGGTCTVHLLAYLFDAESPALKAEQSRLRAERRARLRRMAERMAADGFAVDPDDVMGRLPADSPGGRPHLAQALIRAGVVGSVDEAFAKYLGTGSSYHVSRTDTLVETAIDMIADAGGVTVLAHPFASSRGPIVTASVIADLAGRGLSGVEIDHPDHDRPTRDRLRALAADLSLVVTGSSDYHGTNKVVRLGQETTAPEMLDALVDKASGSQVVIG